MNNNLPLYEQAYEDYKKGLKQNDIADKYKVSRNTVKSWQQRYWKQKSVHTSDEKYAPQDKEVCVPKKGKVSESRAKRGAPPNNKNAIGNAGGAPYGNKNSEKHAIYSKVLWDFLDEQEEQLIGNLPDDEERHLIDEIRLSTVRERRLMKKIQELTESTRGMLIYSVQRSEEKREFDNDEDKELYKERQQAKVDAEKLLPGRSVHVNTTSINNSDLLLRAHAELTRVQSQKTRCIETLNKIRQSKEGSKSNSIAEEWIAALLGGEGEDE